MVGYLLTTRFQQNVNTKATFMLGQQYTNVRLRMGNKFEVKAWEAAIGSDHYYWLEIYRGESLIKALYNLWWARCQGWKCIKLEWRP